MDEKDYELLHALDETRNITHAADKLYMTQSALSKRIKALEQELGVEIVLRSRQASASRRPVNRCCSTALPPPARWKRCAASWPPSRAKPAAPCGPASR